MVQPIGQILQQWAELDIFFYVLPFLLIFALVYSVLQKLKLTGEGDSRGINAVISIAIGLLSLQWDFVPVFFSTLIPRLGMGIGVLLVALILMGLFVNPQKQRGPILIFLIIGGVTAAIVLLNSFSDYTWWTGSFWQENMSAIIVLAIMIVLVVVAIGPGKHDPKDDPFFRIVQGGGGG